ncbi:hypothetical protein KQH42_07245 [Streptomyces sp. CHA1]|uniref:hypothetical protein n=1 Tax=Streptomyces TaxID=1883 RepID=UPI001BFCBB07|nr:MULTISPECIES: hypothetical protein [unclassified Streptomyces]MBT3157365.1 hypothetical protein [Streptomyces sp. G11C]MCO6700310.1 hypothetical protein [Streptomyces sp. CHB9.2]MCO6706446.1 hypothetical protein [Streptomyces sp. CHA3]MCO6712188.1 hypothetical protein [Streptomyces sp. CHB19.2]MCO6718622.1 hypothetical protein [Streptomyces sp. Vc714c-19]
MKTVIPGALADHLTTQTITDTETAAALDGAHRGRGRTLVIEPTNTRVLHVISAYAKAILENRKLHTPAQVRAARLWIQRAGHAPAPAAEQAPAAVRDEPSDWWTIMDPATGEEIARVYGETWQDMTPRAEALPEVRAVIRAHKGFSRRRLYVSELTPAQLAEQADAEREQTAPPADEPAKVPGTLVDPWTWIRRPSSSDADRAAEERAERRQQLADSRGANAYPLAVAAVRQFVRELPRAGALRVRVVEGSPEAILAREDLHALAYSGHTTADAVARVRAAVAAHIRHGEREVHLMFPALGMRPALYLSDVLALLHHWEITQADAEQFDRSARAVDAVEHAEQVEAAVATVEDAEAVYAAALVTEAEATDGTWRGDWIGEQPADDALFVVDGTVEQGALFDDRATEQAPERRVIEGVVVSHGGTAEGSKPKDATNPDVLAAREALAGLAVATLTDHHDVTEPTEDERNTRGYFVDPRTHGRVAVYWLEGGRIVRRDQMPHGPALDCLADRLKRRGWAVEKMLRSSQCVFAHRPSTD